MPNDLRWSLCNNNRNKVHSKCNALESSRNHHPCPVCPYCCLVIQSCPTLCDPTGCSTPGFPVLHHLPEFAQTHMSFESVMPSNHLILCRPLLLLPSIFSSIRVFSNELFASGGQRWSFSFQHQSFQWIFRMISFRIDWFDLLAVQGTLKILPQYHGSKASIFCCSAFFMVQLSHPYITTGKNHSFDYTDLCWQSNISAFSYAV